MRFALLILLCASPAWGQYSQCMPGMPCYQGQCYVQPTPQYQGGPCEPVEEVETEPPIHAEPPKFADVAVSVPLGGGRYGAGSGALVARSASGGTIMVTNSHVMERSEAIVTLSDGRRVRARVVARDAENDIAAVDIPLRLQYAQLTSTNPRGSQVTIRAFDGGVNFRPYEGIVGGGNSLTNAYSVGGNSGAGVYLEGKYAGVLWGNRSNRLSFAGIGPVRRLLDRIRSRYEVVSVTVSQSTAPRKVAVQTSQSCNCASKFESIEAKIASIEKTIYTSQGKEMPDSWREELRKQLSAELDAKIEASVERAVGNFPKPQPGPPGPPGPQGPKGDRGPAGKDADNEAVNERIAALEAELTALRDKKFRIYTHTPYGVFDTEPQGIGEDIHIQYVPAGK